MKIELLFIGKTKEPYLAAAIDDFRKRLGHYVRLEIKTLKEKHGRGRTGDRQIRDMEGDILLQAKSASSLLVALDVSGKQVSSEGLSAKLSRWENQGRQAVTFVIGGPLGLADKVLATADFVLSLSKMTFTHDMSRFILLEQLYRAYTIKAGEKYHK